jgi:hypothetical protein
MRQIHIAGRHEGIGLGTGGPGWGELSAELVSTVA